MDLSLLLALLAGALIACYFFFPPNDCFRKQGIPGPRVVPIFGSWWNSWNESYHEIVERYHEKYGKLYCTFRGRVPQLVVHDIDLLRAILKRDSLQHFPFRKIRPISGKDAAVNSTLSLLHGDQWKVLRAIIIQALNSPAVKQRAALATESIDLFRRSWTAQVKYDQVLKVNMKEEMEILAEEVIVNFVCGTKLGIVSDKNHAFPINARKSREVGTGSWLWVLSNLYTKLLPWVFPHFDSGNEYFVKLAKQMLTDRMKITTSSGADLLDSLLNCLNGNDPKGSPHVDENVAIAQIFSTIMTGYDLGTVSARVLHCLAMNPLEQHKCRQEINQAFDQQALAGNNSVGDLPYVEQCIRETLRLYPTAFATYRSCWKDKQYDQVFIPKGAVVEIPMYLIQRDPEIYPEPEKFLPSRFGPDGPVSKDPFTFLAFGQGPRACPAQKLSTLVIKQCVAHLLSHFEFIPVAETKDPMTFTATTSAMFTAGDIWLGVKEIVVQ